MALLFLIVFINLVGFGIIIPLMPFYVLHLGAGPELIMLIFSVYSGTQFLTAPFLGRLSDRYGRKPILAVTLFGAFLSYIILAYADSLWMLVLSRFIGGAMAGNLGIAYAYVTDITTPENRSKGMGLMGAAFGLGFIFGPVIGGVLAGPEVETANYFLPAIASGALTLVAFIGVLTILPESLSTDARQRVADKPAIPIFTHMWTVLSRPALAMLVGMGFLFVTAWALLESIMGFFADARFDYGPEALGYLTAWMGIIGVIVQGGLIGPLTKRFGEYRLVVAALVLGFAGFTAFATAFSLAQLLVALTLLGISSGLFNPNASSLVSKESTEADRGIVLGIYQGAGSLGRVVGPAFAGPVFAFSGVAVPFFIAAALMVPAMILILLAIQRSRLAPS